MGLVRRDYKADGTLKDVYKCKVWDLVRTVDGKRRAKRFVGNLTEAKKALAAWEAEEDARVATITFGQFAREWMEGRERTGSVSPNTLASDRQRLAKCKAWEDRPIAEITAKDVERLIEDLREGRTGKRWSATSCTSWAKSLSSLFGSAVAQGLAKENPVKKAKKPSVKNEPPKEKEVPRPEAVDRLVERLDAAAPAQRAVALCCCLGLRRGEACALRWRDVDFNNCLVTVRRSKAPNGTVGAPKNGKERTVPIPKALMEFFGKMPYEQKRRMVGTHEICPMVPTSLTRWWSRHRAGLGMANVTLHGLRHAYCTRLALKRVSPRTAQQLMGHSSLQTTLAIYSHVYGEEELVEAVNDAWG